MRDCVSALSGNVSAKKGNDGRNTHRHKISDIITESGASGMISDAPKLL